MIYSNNELCNKQNKGNSKYKDTYSKKLCD